MSLKLLLLMATTLSISLAPFAAAGVPGEGDGQDEGAPTDLSTYVGVTPDGRVRVVFVCVNTSVSPPDVALCVRPSDPWAPLFEILP